MLLHSLFFINTLSFFDFYYRQLIKFLVDKCSFDFSSALKDESKEDFSDYRYIPLYSLYPLIDHKLSKLFVITHIALSLKKEYRLS